MNKNKIISLCMAVIMSTSAFPITAFASSVGSISTDTSIGEDTSQSVKTQYTEIAESDTQTQVYLSVDDSNLKVSLPTTVILSGTPNKQGQYVGKYSVGVNGDISGDKIVKIVPDTDIALIQKGKTNISATVSQKQTAFSTTDFSAKTTTTGTVTADNLTAGSWNSSFNFNISTIANAVPDGYTLLYRYDLSATSSDDVAAFYCVPTENTEKIGDTSQKNAVNTLADETSEIEDSKVIEYNGVKYILSDKDKLVITGTGNMKENIASELIDWNKFLNSIVETHSLIDWTEHYNIPKNKGLKIVPETDYNEDILWGKEVEPEVSKKSIKLKFLSWKFGVGHIEREIRLDWSGATIYPSLSYHSDNQPIPITYNNYLRWNDNQKNPDWFANQVINNDPNSDISTINAYYSYLIKYIQSIENEISVTIPREVVIEDGVTNISKDAFYKEIRLKKITIPNSVKSIGDNAFYGCTNLTNLDFLSGGIEEIGRAAFSNCNFDNIIIPGNVKTIKPFAFYNQRNTISTLTIEEGVETIEDQAFYRVNTLHLAKSVKNYGNKSFANIKELYYDGTLDDYMNIKLIPEINKRTGALIYDYSNTTFPLSASNEVYFNNVKCDKNNFVIPASITSIPDGIFARAAINNVKFEGNVTSIGDYAFYNLLNNDKKYFYLPSTITNIGKNAFCVEPLTTNFKGREFYCQSQTVADLLIVGTNYDKDSDSTITVDVSKF